MRLGGSYAALKANSWFDNFDWVNKYLKIKFFYYF